MNDSISVRDNRRRALLVWSAPFAAIVLGHMVVDAFAQMVPASLGLIQERWNLSDRQGAWFLGVGSLCSGLAQPGFAWLSDRTGNRIFGGLGIALVGLLFGSLGMAANPFFLFVFYIVGMIGNGMFHPIAASTIGQLDPNKRSFAVSCFFVAGMAGGVIGAALGPRLLVLDHGFEWLRLAIIPAMGVGFFLYRSIHSVEHRSTDLVSSKKGNRSDSNWGAVALLYGSATARFMVNLALLYLFVRLAEASVADRSPEFDSGQVSRMAAPLAGNLNAATITGMAIGGFLSGILIPAGREKWPFLLIPFLCAPMVALLPWLPLHFSYLLAGGAGIGFASLVPVTIALAQRFLPSRTSLASGLMMGGAWSMAMFGPALADLLLKEFGMQAAFAWIAALLAASGLFVLPIKSEIIRRSVSLNAEPGPASEPSQ